MGKGEEFYDKLPGPIRFVISVVVLTGAALILITPTRLHPKATEAVWRIFFEAMIETFADAGWKLVPLSSPETETIKHPSQFGPNKRYNPWAAT